MKFSAMKVDFDDLSLDFLGSRKPAHEGIKERYVRKSRYFTVVGQSFVKTAGVRLTVWKQEPAIGFRAFREHWLKFLVFISVR